MVQIKEIFPGVYEFGKFILTKNMVPGKKVYGEEHINHEGIEYRVWDPFRSKLGAAIKKGLKEMPIKEGSVVLYLGAAEGTTISHVSDIVGERGVVFGVDISARAMQKFIYLCEDRKNIVPILADGNLPHTYKEEMGGYRPDVIFQDVSQKNQAQIFLKNSRMHLKMDGWGMLTVKARSISAKGSAKDLYAGETKQLEAEFDLKEVISLEPFEKEHAMAVGRRK
ncbi:MAG: fibrillarin-like rRNA/tRNA 2'-O-methyltransferase [Candidatus Diapherotrites archaeon]